MIKTVTNTINEPRKDIYTKKEKTVKRLNPGKKFNRRRCNHQTVKIPREGWDMSNQKHEECIKNTEVQKPKTKPRWIFADSFDSFNEIEAGKEEVNTVVLV